MLIKKRLRFLAAMMTPKCVAAPLYRLALRLVQDKATALGLKLWARHSYQLGHWSPFLSDIDVSISTSRTSRDPSLREYLRYHKFVRKYLPILGEVNFYFEDGIFAEHICPLELEKDPRLEDLLGFRPQPSQAWRTLFVLKALEYNREDLFSLRTPVLQPAKWQYFSGLVQLKNDRLETLIESCFKLIADYFDRTPEFTLDNVAAFFQALGLGTSFETLEMNPTVSTLFLNRFVHRRPDAILTSQAASEFLSVLISWEIWGIATQLPIAQFDSDMRIGFLAHLNNLSMFLVSHPGIPNEGNLIHGLNGLISRLQENSPPVTKRELE